MGSQKSSLGKTEMKLTCSSGGGELTQNKGVTKSCTNNKKGICKGLGHPCENNLRNK